MVSATALLGLLAVLHLVRGQQTKTLGNQTLAQGHREVSLHLPLCGLSLDLPLGNLAQHAFVHPEMLARHKRRLKWDTGDPLRIVVIGGSETAGAECMSEIILPESTQCAANEENIRTATDGLFYFDEKKWKNKENEALCSWSARLVRKFSEGLGHDSALLLNAAVHATSTEGHLARAAGLFEGEFNIKRKSSSLTVEDEFGMCPHGSSLGENVDLILLDLSANDGWFYKPSKRDAHTARHVLSILESYVRYLLALPSAPIVAYVHAEGLNTAETVPGANAIHRLYGSIASWYDLPVIAPHRALRTIVDTADASANTSKMAGTLKYLGKGVKGKGHMKAANHEYVAATVYEVLSQYIIQGSKSRDAYDLPIPLSLECDSENAEDLRLCHMAKGAHQFYDFTSTDAKENEKLYSTAITSAAGWTLEPDQIGRVQGWLQCKSTTPTDNKLVIPVKFHDGELCVGYLRSYSTNMGAVRMDLKLKNGTVVKSYFINAWDPTRHVSITDSVCFENLNRDITTVNFISVDYDELPEGMRAKEGRRRLLTIKDMTPNKIYCAQGGKFKLISIAVF